MKLYATTTSERATKGQGGNDNLIVEFTVQDGNGRPKIGEIELCYHTDSDLKGIEQDEWVLLWRQGTDVEEDPEIIAQGHVTPKKTINK
jgi:hypothetical protein